MVFPKSSQMMPPASFLLQENIHDEEKLCKQAFKCLNTWVTGMNAYRGQTFMSENQFC